MRVYYLFIYFSVVYARCGASLYRSGRVHVDEAPVCHLFRSCIADIVSYSYGVEGVPVLHLG